MNEWIKNTGTMPVKLGTLVDIIHRHGDVYMGIEAGIDGYCMDWSLDEKMHNGDIVLWKLHKQETF